MSYRIIIVDDEPKLVQLVRQLGHWEELHIEIVDECHNGEEAFASIVEKTPDFVLSDIKMPGCDGIELIQRVRDANLDPLFVLLSGYRHFEYARSAIQLNVMDYLLKPIDEEQLNETLKKVCARVDLQRLQKKESDVLTEYRTIQNQAGMEKFWRCLIYRDAGYADMKGAFDSVEECNAAFHTSFGKECYQVLHIFTNLGSILGKEETAGSEGIDAFIHDSFADMAILYYNASYMGYVLVLNYDRENEARIRDAVRALYIKIRDLREIYGEFHVNIGCSRVKTDIAKLIEAEFEAHSAEWGRLVLLQSGVLDYAQIASLPQFSPEELITGQEKQRLGECIRYLRGEELGAIFEELYRRCGQLRNCHPGSFMDAFFGLSNLLVDSAAEAEAGNRMTEQAHFAYVNARSYAQAVQNLYMVCEKYIQEEQEKLKEKKGKPILTAVKFIKEHFREQISLEDVADGSNVSPNYLSKLFKSEMQVGFNEYLTQIRLEESQHLLAETNLSIREVASQVGYLDEKYYAKLFKKNTGIKPTDYRRIYS